MKNILAVAALAVATIAGAGAAQAGQGIPNLLAQPVVSASAPAVIGEAYPAFGAAATPVVSARIADVTVGQNYPTIAAPHRATRFAQIGQTQGRS
ncbi:hypothetical protein [Acidiphilium iwatense]|uniref:Uncharacterized protein n=1 Tax=Acidiphilium iwatense TaxID=768198 RepID=A0ABS9E0M6_9PROT|nr:hypothetical protein [Acidiphilium iwatense]MCF3947945.1 hypothetical protein [Acidiphilium iwatense]